MIKKMMEVYGWTIQETGEPGRGAQFTITIPNTNRRERKTIKSTDTLQSNPSVLVWVF